MFQRAFGLIFLMLCMSQLQAQVSTAVYKADSPFMLTFEPSFIFDQRASVGGQVGANLNLNEWAAFFVQAGYAQKPFGLSSKVGSTLDFFPVNSEQIGLGISPILEWYQFNRTNAWKGLLAPYIKSQISNGESQTTIFLILPTGLEFYRSKYREVFGASVGISWNLSQKISMTHELALSVFHYPASFSSALLVRF